MSLEPNRQQYLQQLGIETWQRRVDASFFPGAAQDVSGFVDQQLADEFDSSPASDEIIHLQSQKLVPQEQVTKKFYCVFEFADTNCIVAIETESFEESISQENKRILMGILRAIGVSDLPISTPIFLENISEIKSSLKENMLLLYFGATIEGDFSEHAGGVFCSDSLQRIAGSADSKRDLWLRLKQWNISNSFIG
ncbi:MAG: hypothetical protein P1U80_00665 [Pseudomonadales bacterium]|nr:hypothetical protein [Pseudomonadales bacterium]